MGQGSTVHFNGYHKGQLGWLAPANERTATTSGTYTVAPLSTSSAGVQSLRIRRSPGEWIYCDLRAPVGGPFEQFSPSDPATQGVMLRLAPDYTTIERSKLLDATPGDVRPSTTPRCCPARRSPTPSAASRSRPAPSRPAARRCEVTVPGGGGGDTTPPGTPTGLAAHLAAGGVQLAWNAAPGAEGVVAYRVLRDGIQIGSAATSRRTSTRPRRRGRRVAYAIVAVDGGGQRQPRPTPVTIDVPAAAPPAPFAVTAAPLGASSVSLSWAAVQGATSYRVLRDGAHVQTVTGHERRRPGPHARVRRYTYGVVAVDAGGTPIATSGAAEIALPVVDPPAEAARRDAAARARRAGRRASPATAACG